ncbi:ThuA domain-containing protein [Mucilaginibacter pallidiroseus]|uniref:ThuA domain-containing protein n=1 Tax=Mucilaginibacter pallidiroseus TaxID=2599295 RepID=A0A563U7Q5_9SPHI|nr:ThuA domain-containing protein [Mucilaginibacter pallidiroseus]TWR27380.1 ThuA domain-containing protein [Mucilaginibacter pallidiroseus]
MKKCFILFCLGFIICSYGFGQKVKNKFNVLALYENGGHHVAYSAAAKVWLNKLAATNHFKIDYIQNTDKIDTAFLSHYQLFIQLDYPPYGWKPAAAAAFQDYIENGKGGWIGFHHATLLGEFDAFPMWQWFSTFMGNIIYKDYIATFVQGTISVENAKHRVMQGIPSSFIIKQEEFYIYNQSPRPNVRVLATVNEDTYKPNSAIKMGDHPVIWVNEHVKARNVYIFMGHSPTLFNNPAYTRLFKNAIFWAAAKSK